MSDLCDAETATFGEMSAAEATSDDDIRQMVEAGELMPCGDEPFRGPEEWHRTGWDVDREDG